MGASRREPAFARSDMTDSSPSPVATPPSGALPPPDAFRPQDEREPTLRRLKWTFLITLILLFVFVEFSRYLLASYLDTLGGRLVMDLVILVGGVFFFGAVFDCRVADAAAARTSESGAPRSSLGGARHLW